MKKDIFAPIRELKFVDRDQVRPNDYNPNKVLRKNLDLLKQSILQNGFCFPIVIRPDYTIIDGFHRWLITGEEPLKEMMGNKIPVVVVNHDSEEENQYGTITFNRARGTHLLEPMKNIVKNLLDKGKTVDEISKQLGMSEEEIFRLSDIDRDKFLEIASKRSKRYTNAKKYTRVK